VFALDVDGERGKALLELLPTKCLHAARISGKSISEIRDLVVKLEAARKIAP